MNTEDFKILESDFVGKGVSAQPNPMEKSEEEAKAVFDELVKDVVTPKFNAFVDAFKEVDLTADNDKPVSDAAKTALDKKVDKELRAGSETEYKGLSDNNYSDEEKKKVADAAGKMHEHKNTEVLDSIRQQDVDNWNGDNVLTKDNEQDYTPTADYHPATKKYVDDKLIASGAADMLQSMYDPQGRHEDIFAAIDKVAKEAGKSEALSKHTADANIHVTAEQKAAWDGKAAGDHDHGDMYYTKEEVDERLQNAGSITYGTEDLEAGVSPLAEGAIYFRYK